MAVFIKKYFWRSGDYFALIKLGVGENCTLWLLIVFVDPTHRNCIFSFASISWLMMDWHTQACEIGTRSFFVMNLVIPHNAWSLRGFEKGACIHELFSLFVTADLSIFILERCFSQLHILSWHVGYEDLYVGMWDVKIWDNRTLFCAE